MTEISSAVHRRFIRLCFNADAEMIPHRQKI